MLAYETWIRMGCFFGLFAILALWELWAPRRQNAFPRAARWPSNIGIVVLNTVLLRVIFPVSAVGLAQYGEYAKWGLFNSLSLPSWLAIAVAVILLDLAIYFQHVLFHAVPALWRLHRMHHADLDFDVTTGTRFHSVEIILSMLIKFAVIAALGTPAVAVLLFEVLLNATSMFNHANVRIPARIDRWLRWIVVTPDMHRLHHSIYAQETNSNFGFNLPWWDRLFGTYRAEPKDGHEHMIIGIEQFRTEGDLRLDRMLLQPLRGPASTYPINRVKG